MQSKKSYNGELAQHMVKEHAVSVRQACKALHIPRSTQNYCPVQKDDTAVIEQLQVLVEKHPAIGFWQSFYRIRRQGLIWRLQSVYRPKTQYPQALP